MDFEFLFDLEMVNRLNCYFSDDADRPHAADGRLEQIVCGRAFVNGPLTVDNLKFDDGVADKTPVPLLSTRPVNIGRENAADALRVVRRQSFECQSLVQEELHHVAHSRPSFEGPLVSR